MIAAHELCFHYAGADHHALSRVTFSLPKGSLALLCGANGSGKSTLLRLLAGLLQPDSGTLRCGRCALVMQGSSHQILGSTVGDDMLLPWPRPTEMQRKKARDLAGSFGLSMDDDVQHLSGGQKRRLCIASALMAGPDVLLMDEPSSSLDYPACLQLVHCLGRLRNSGMTILLSTHDPSLFVPAMQDGDPLLVLEQGVLSAILPLRDAQDAILKHPGWGVRPWA
ncbi:MAG: ABC transporter ATP-binding protein [Desulfovibrio sp.]|jgi:biotin transport system ATP-binding protein|nr:ABC transporter ATP-binding protein [Mailhella sp.]